MININKGLSAAIRMPLSKNALLLFNLFGEPVKFSYQRHICGKITDQDNIDKILNTGS